VTGGLTTRSAQVLERAGLIRRRVEGRSHWLTADAAPLAEAEAWIARSRAFWEGRLDALDEVLRGG
jgi:hypothetical protein